MPGPRRPRPALTLLTAGLAAGIAAGFAAATAVAGQEWTIERLGTGTKPEIALAPDGQVRIAFLTEELHGGLFHARRVGGQWEIETLTEGYFYGPLDLTVDGAGASHIVYHDHQEQLFEPQLGDAAYATDAGGSWQLETVSDRGHDGWDGSIAIGPDGRVHIASIDPAQFGSRDGVEWAVRGADGWTVMQVGSGAVPYEFATDIAVDAEGRAHITYHDGTERRNNGGGSDLHYVVYDPAAQTFARQVVDSDGDVGKFASLALDGEGTPHVAYLEWTETNAGFVRYARPGDGGDWVSERVDGLDDLLIAHLGARHTVSLAMGPGGAVHVAYCDRSRLKLAVRADDGSWQIDTVAEPSAGMILGQLASLALEPSGRPHIAFYELPESPRNSTGEILYARGPAPVTTAVSGAPDPAPETTSLPPSYPNPFNGATTIPFRLQQPGRVELALFDLAGQRVLTLASGVHAAGDHAVVWDGRDADGRSLASGLYLTRLRSGGGESVRRIALIR